MKTVAMATESRIVKKRVSIQKDNSLLPTGWLLLALLLESSMLVAGFHYEAPSDCQWTLMNSSTSSGGTSSSSSSAGVASSSGIGSAGHLAMASMAGANDVALHCRLRTINSQFDQTNFSVVPREHTAALTIECSDSLLYQR